MKGGYVDWIISTGANLYHDLHFGLDMPARHGQRPAQPSCGAHRQPVIISPWLSQWLPGGQGGWD
jgi:hypothetical protein